MTSSAARGTGFSTEYVELAGEHLDKVDDRIRRFDLEIDGLIRDAEVYDVEPSVPNHKRITELVLLLLQIRDNSERINDFLLRSVHRHAPDMTPDGLVAIRDGLTTLVDVLNEEVDGEPFPFFVRRYLETISYPGYSHIERGITELTSMEAYKVAYTPGVARMCLLIQALNAHIALLSNLSFMDLRGRMRKVIHVLQDRLLEAVRSLTGSTGSIHIPRLSNGTDWRSPSTRQWETHPVLRAARAYIESLPGPLCLVVTDQTAVLGLEDIGALAGHPVMVGKGKINAAAGRFTALPVSIDPTDDGVIVDVTEYLARAAGVRAINLEDITGKEGRCFRIQRELQGRLEIPIFHDDQDGTAIITLAGLLTALEDQGKRLDDVKIVISGAGAAGVKIAQFLLGAGARGERLLMLDSRGLLSRDRPDMPSLNECDGSEGTQREKIELLAEIRSDLPGAWAEAVKSGASEVPSRDVTAAVDRSVALEGADVFIGMSAANILTTEHLRSMADRPVVFACANPDPEIAYDVAVAARDDLVFGSGSSLHPNQINNAVAFPGFLAGLMLSRARSLDLDAGIVAARAIAARTRDIRKVNPSFEEVVPKVIDGPLHRLVALATARDVYARGLNLGDDGKEPEIDEPTCVAEIEARFGGAE